MIRRKLRRSLRRLRARTGHLARHNYMLGVTLVILGAVGAASLGAFGDNNRPTIAALPTPAPYVPQASGPAYGKELTFFLVNADWQEIAITGVEDGLTYREFLVTSEWEVLMIRTPEQEQTAFQAIDEARANPLYDRVIVHDFRGQQ